MDGRSTEELYEQYKNEMYQIEESLEHIQYKKRELAKEKEERRVVFREEEGLESEYQKIKQQEMLCEERYQEGVMQLTWREEEWQE